jgi:hypothetical protein
VVDLGRYTEGDTVSGSWLRRSDVSVLVVPGDASAAVNLRDQAPRLLDACDGRLGLVVVGGTYGCRDLAAFTGIVEIVGIADLPFDPSAAASACGAPGSGRRLELSLLWAAIGRMAASLSDRLESDRSATDRPATDEPATEGPAEPADEPSDVGDLASATVPRARRSSLSGMVGRVRSRVGREVGQPTERDDAASGDADTVDSQVALREVGG